MKKIGFLLLSFGFIGLSNISCKEKVAPVSERIAKNWTASSVKEGTSVVYTKGGTSNVRPGYSSFSLNLAAAPTASLREFDNNSFTGQYEVTDTKLTLKSLNPQPTGTGGTIEYTIVSLNNEGTELKLLRTTPSQKTGSNSNEYTLVSQ
ncbi:MAG: hypothetical protein MUF45_10715 [Spirosomaceae bacterium]|jgi:hypothetical protein|nr:hypothetical protein [Spirosomataceae bacterium]